MAVKKLRVVEIFYALLWRSMLQRLKDPIERFFVIFAPATLIYFVILVVFFCDELGLYSKKFLTSADPTMMDVNHREMQVTFNLKEQYHLFSNALNDDVIKFLESIKNITNLRITIIKDDNTFFDYCRQIDYEQSKWLGYIKFEEFGRQQVSFNFLMPRKNSKHFANPIFYEQTGTKMFLDDYHDTAIQIVQAKLSCFYENGPLCNSKGLHVRNMLSIYKDWDHKSGDPVLHSYNAKIMQLFSFTFLFGYALVIPFNIKRLVIEREAKSREFYRIFGLTQITFWASNFTASFLDILVNLFVVYMLLFKSQLAPVNAAFTDRVNPWVFSFIYLVSGIQFICWSFFISSFFTSTVFAVCTSLVVWFSLFGMVLENTCPFYGIASEYSNAYRCLTALLPWGSFFHCMSLQNLQASHGVPLDWSTLMDLKTIPNMSHWTILVYAILSLPIYVFFAFYIDSISSSMDGMPQQWLNFIDFHFINKKSYGKAFTRPLENLRYFEDPPIDAQIKIQILGADNVYVDSSTTMNASSNFSADFYENQITVLLGHSGSGKTTLLSMIAGVFPFSTGIIKVNGYRLDTQTEQARLNMTFSPQNHIPDQGMTISQLLKYFALLKYVPLSRVTYEVNLVIGMLQLEAERDVLVARLTSADKKKVDLGVAMIGDTNILLLDEPTCGMDRDSSRQVWNLLLTIKKFKTIILSTYSVEEAEVLGDRVLIMNQGEIFCYGSPGFLRANIRNGYILRIHKNPNFNSEYFLEKARSFILDSKIVSQSEKYTTYLMNPIRSLRDDRMVKLFSFIESYRKNLHIKSFTLSHTTLEDAFLAVMSSFAQNKPVSTIKTYSKIEGKITDKCTLFRNRWSALFSKRFNMLKKQRFLYLSHIFIPALIIYCCDIMMDAFLRQFKTQTYEPDTFNKNFNAFYEGPDDFSKAFLASNEKYYNITIYTATDKANPRDIMHKNSEKVFLYGLTMGDNATIWVNCSNYDGYLISMSAFYNSLSLYNSKLVLKPKYTAVPSLADIDAIREILSWKMITIFCALAFSFLGAIYIIFPVSENVTKLKYLQMMSGVTPLLYWACNFAFDMCLHLASTLVLNIVLWVLDYNQTTIVNTEYGMFFAMIVICYGLAAIPFAYFLSFFFEDPRECWVKLFIFNIYISFLCNFFTTLYNLINNLLLKFRISNYLTMIFSMFPVFVMLDGIQRAYLVEKLLKPMMQYNPVCYNLQLGDPRSLAERYYYCNQSNGLPLLDSTRFSLDSYGSGFNLLLLCLVGFIYFMLTLAIEAHYFNPKNIFRRSEVMKKPEKSGSKNLTTFGNEVIAEATRIKTISEKKVYEDAVIVHNLCKKVDDNVILNSLSFGVSPHECFGLFGLNGSGKTTLLSIIAGDILPTSGEVVLLKGRYHSKKNYLFSMDDVSYCPQNNPVVDYLTGEELLELFGSLRGIPQTSLKQEVKKVMELIGLQDQCKLDTINYSAGNRRKLSVGVALIGLPKLILLDEPTAGLDPHGRRKLWHVLKNIQKQRQTTVVLTSQLVEECEALCSKVVVLMDGQIRCLGLFRDLRRKYSDGFTITIILNKKFLRDSRHSEEVQARLLTKVLTASLQQNLFGLMKFYVSDKRLRWSQLFQILANLNHHFEFEDYYVCDTNLDQLFISLNKDYKEAET